MPYEYTYVDTTDGRHTYATNGDVIVLTAVLIPETPSGGGRSLTTLERIKIPVKLDYELEGIKAFSYIRILTLIGTVEDILYKVFSLLGTISELKTIDGMLSGILSEQVEEELEIAGGVLKDLVFSSAVTGVSSQTIEQEIVLTSDISNTISLFKQAIGIKQMLETSNFDLIGIKQKISNIKFELAGKRDIRKIIVSLMD